MTFACFHFFLACVKYINLSALIPKLNEQGLLTSEEEKSINNSTLKLTERMETLIQCVAKKESGWKKFLTALKAETSHDGHKALLKTLPSIEGTHTHTDTHTHSNIHTQIHTHYVLHLNT